MRLPLVYPIPSFASVVLVASRAVDSLPEFRSVNISKSGCRMLLFGLMKVYGVNESIDKASTEVCFVSG
jgi:hypothetical protein